MFALEILQHSIKITGLVFLMMIVIDFDYVKTILVEKIRYPKHGNEIPLSEHKQK